MIEMSSLENFIREAVKEFIYAENVRFEVECEGEKIKKITITSGTETTELDEGDSIIVKEAEDEKEEDIVSEIKCILKKIGVPANIKGYRYIIDAVLLCYTDMKALDSGITKTVYPLVARKNDTTPSRTERAIRHAIEVAWKRGDLSRIEELFGYTIASDKGKLTNSEFLAIIADYLYLEHKKY